MKKTNVLFVSSECVPFVKTGGLADVIGALPKYFDKEKTDCRVILPKYGFIPEKFQKEMEFVLSFTTGFCFRDQYVGIYKLLKDGVTFYFVDSAFYFSGPVPYGEVYDDIEKFAFFCRAVLSALPLIGFQPDVIHCHDWQSALVPVYLNDYFQGDVFFHKIKTVMTIHNLKFQGVYDVKTVRQKTGLSEYYFTDDKMKHYENGNLLKGGLVYADRITTVSGTYAEEIKTDYYGEGLNGLIVSKQDKLLGIVNGIDNTVYNPETDENIPVHYNSKNFLEGKKANKAHLQKELGLPERDDVLLIGMVTRLTDQKGLDLVTCVLTDILKRDVQLVVLGTGEKRYEDFFKGYEYLYPDKVRACIYFSEELSRRIYAGTDAFLMPSLFEPCGLSQLLALRYGSLPIVRETGGLKDTVMPYNEYTNEGTGFSFTYYNAHDMLHVIEYCDDVFKQHRDRFADLTKRAMAADFSWKNSAAKYEKMYAELLTEKEAEEKPFKKTEEKK